jgi:hypothetical protein
VTLLLVLAVGWVAYAADPTLRAATAIVCLWNGGRSLLAV